MPTPTQTPPTDDAAAKAAADKAAADKAAADKAAAEALARIAELEAANAALQEQVDAQAAKIAEPELPEGYAYVVDGAGQPMLSNPYVPKSWLTADGRHLLPEGAKKATKEQEAAVKAAVKAARKRP